MILVRWDGVDIWHGVHGVIWMDDARDGSSVADVRESQSRRENTTTVRVCVYSYKKALTSIKHAFNF